MKHHLAFLATILTIVILFAFTSKAQAQDINNFAPTQEMASNERDAGNRFGIFYITPGGCFEHEGKYYVYADGLKNDNESGLNTTCMISTDKRFETFRMIAELKDCRTATESDLIYLSRFKAYLYVMVNHKDENGYTVLIRVKSQKDIDNDLDKVERANDLISRSIYARN